MAIRCHQPSRPRRSSLCQAASPLVCRYPSAAGSGAQAAHEHRRVLHQCTENWADNLYGLLQGLGVAWLHIELWVVGSLRDSDICRHNDNVVQLVVHIAMLPGPVESLPMCMVQIAVNDLK